MDTIQPGKFPISPIAHRPSLIAQASWFEGYHFQTGSRTTNFRSLRTLLRLVQFLRDGGWPRAYRVTFLCLIPMLLHPSPACWVSCSGRVLKALLEKRGRQHCRLR